MFVAPVQSARVRDFLYAVRWYEMDATFRADMRLVMLQSERPLFMTGGKFFVLNYGTFVVVSKLMRVW